MLLKLPSLFWFWIILCLCSPLLTSCQLPATVEAGKSTVTVDATSTDSQITNPVCNPLGGGTSLGGEHGLKADLYYLDPSLPHYNHVADYLANGTKTNATLFFDQVNIPTRPFDAGFVTTAGSVITTPQGNTLYEWFAIDFTTIVKLAGSNTAGNKQFALLTDDGAILEQKVNDHWETVVDNDGTHASRFAVARAPILFDASSAVNFRLRYFQGPRYHIAAILMWRDWNGGADDPADGTSGNSLFFDSTHTPSVAQPAYNALLARGWKPVAPENFFLTDSTPVNPCPPDPVVTATATATATDTSTSTTTATSTSTATLAITGFDGVTGPDTADLIWQTTGVPADGKILWGSSVTALTQTAVETATTNTVHQVHIGGLTSATQYFFQAVSTDAQGTTASSGVIHKVTK
jgi:hypothetical protein